MDMKPHRRTGEHPRRHPLVRGFIGGTASLFDVFGIRARPRKPRTQVSIALLREPRILPILVRARDQIRVNGIGVLR
jgi:hypothetical protein